MNVHAVYARERPETATGFVCADWRRWVWAAASGTPDDDSDDTIPTAEQQANTGRDLGTDGLNTREHDEQPEVHNNGHGEGG